MLTVACVLRSGGDFEVSWVERLERACFEKIREPHRFVCLTDIPSSGPRSFIDWIPLRHDWPGWWAKIELFRPDLFAEDEPILYFDLDTIVVRNIEHLSGAIDCDLVLLRDFYRLKEGWGTGVMGWSASHGLSQIYETFAADSRRYISKYRSDQDFIKVTVEPSWVRFWQDEFPEQIVSYKVHCIGGLPASAHVVCFHGRPRPTEVFGNWVQEHWSKR